MVNGSARRWATVGDECVSDSGAACSAALLARAFWNWGAAGEREAMESGGT
jgi:hypothetical protein